MFAIVGPGVRRDRTWRSAGLVWLGGFLDHLLSVIRVALMLASITALGTGCFHYVASPNLEEAPNQWSNVRVHLAAPAEYPAGKLLVLDTETLAGQFVERTNDGFVLSLFWIQSMSGAKHPAEGERINVPVGNIASVETRHLAPLLTGAAMATIALGVVLVPAKLLGGGGETSVVDDGGENPTFPLRSR